MIGRLPMAVEVDGLEHKIRTDYRDILRIFEAFNDNGLSDKEKWTVALVIFYEDIPQNVDEAIKQFTWFLNRGADEGKKTSKPLYDWEQDEQMIFQAVNKVAGKEVRELTYMHWWTFLGLFSEIGESMFSSVVNIRNKKNKGKSLEKHEREFYRDNKDIVDLKKRYSNEQLPEELRRVLGI